MSHLGVILGISDLEVERVERDRGIAVYARPTKRLSCIYCQHKGVKIKATYQRTLKHSRQGNRLLTLHLKAPKYYCPHCQRYFRHRFHGVRPRFRATEAFRLEVFEAHDGGVTQRKLARTHHISPATVERWYRSQCELRRSEISNRPCPRILGIDEHFFTRKKGYATTLVDLRKHRVFDVTLGRSELSLRRYLSRLPGKDHVQVVVMDLSETYRRIARRYFPQATIVADRFHVIRLVNQHFLKAWQQQDAEGRKNRGLLSLMLPGFLRLIDQLKASPLRGLAKTLTSWLEPIVAMWRFSKTNGITEGFHTKMEMMTRRAFGFRNFENYRLRVLTHCGWDGIINRV